MAGLCEDSITVGDCYSSDTCGLLFLFRKHVNRRRSASWPYAGLGNAYCRSGTCAYDWRLLSIRAEKPEYILAAVINVVLGLGGLSLLYGGGLWVYETIRRVQIFEPGELSFRVGYGTLSAVSFAIFNLWVRKSNTFTTHSRTTLG